MLFMVPRSSFAWAGFCWAERSVMVDIDSPVRLAPPHGDSILIAALAAAKSQENSFTDECGMHSRRVSDKLDPKRERLAAPPPRTSPRRR
jgi:hypothetical protein